MTSPWSSFTLSSFTIRAFKDSSWSSSAWKLACRITIPNAFRIKGAYLVWATNISWSLSYTFRARQEFKTWTSGSAWCNAKRLKWFSWKPDYSYTAQGSSFAHLLFWHRASPNVLLCEILPFSHCRLLVTFDCFLPVYKPCHVERPLSIKLFLWYFLTLCSSVQKNISFRRNFCW